ncbi:MAG: thioredoxin domain-containing protein [Sphingomonadaceae bacterium]
MLMPIRLSLALLAGVALASCGETKAPADAPAGAAAGGNGGATAATDWSQAVVATPEGGFRMGNPDAPVKLIEYASFTCGVCQRFHLEGAEALKSGLVRAGRVSYEYRPFLLNAIDVAAAMVATCRGPDQFFTWADQLYRNHDTWVQPFTKISDADLKPLGNLPQDQQVRRLAVLGGFDAFVRPRGMARAEFETCMADSERMKRLMDTQETAMQKMQVTATPTFFLNGRKVEGATSWDALRPRIEQALR